MNYIEEINKIKPKANLKWTVLDLFAGCGGLSLGFEAVGFKTIGYEMDKMAAETYNKNLKGKCIEKRLNEQTTFDTKYPIIIGRSAHVSHLVLVDIKKEKKNNKK